MPCRPRVIEREKLLQSGSGIGCILLYTTVPQPNCCVQRVGDASGVTPAPARRSGSSRCPVCPVRVARITWVTIACFPAAFFPRCKAMHLEQGGRDEHAEQSCSDYGCRSGIGKATALAFAREAGRSRWSAAAVSCWKRRCARRGWEARHCGADGRCRPAGRRALFARVKEAFGRVDAVFNNAGQNAPGVSFEELPYERWKAVVDTNLTGVFLCAQAAFR